MPLALQMAEMLAFRAGIGGLDVRAWGLIALLMLGGCALAPATQTAAANSATECRQMKVPGSNVPQHICQTKAQWARFDRQSQQGIDDFTRDRAQQTTAERDRM